MTQNILTGTQRGEALSANDQRKWYVLYTKPRWEKKVGDLLRQRGFEVYVPLNRVHRQWSDRKKLVLEPLFKGYVFIRIERENLSKPLSTPGILNYVYWLKKPAVVREREIESIQRFLHEYSDVRVEKLETVKLSDKVEILQGPFMDKSGEVRRVSGQTVSVAIESLGFQLVVTLQKADVRVVEKDSTLN
jgi:transcription antitermination factor NusG